MFSKLLFAAIPFLSALAPVCSSPSSGQIQVFASMMSDNPYRTPRKLASNTGIIDPEQIHFDEGFRVMSFNIGTNDDLKHAWDERKSRVSSMIRFHRADLIGLQEPRMEQTDDLNKALPEYKSFTGISNPIFFRKSRFQLLASGTFPHPDAKFPRATSWVKLLDKKNKNEFFFFNTHFDYFSRSVRDESAELLKAKVAEIAGQTPFIITGDFNLFPDLGGEETYKLLTDVFKDAQILAQFPHHGPTGTWSGFKEAGQPGIKPDYIFVSPKVEVFLHGVLSDTFDGQFPSDHLPVVADLLIQ